jgi:hypothetical protein
MTLVKGLGIAGVVLLAASRGKGDALSGGRPSGDRYCP